MDLIAFGSCVTRDTVPALEQHGLHLDLYVARQSVASIGHPVLDEHFTSRHLTSKFQDRNYHGDLRGDALERFARSSRRTGRHCAMVWDLTDERGGVLVGPDGAVLTRTSDITTAGFLADVPDNWSPHHFGTLHHWLMFKDAVEDLAENLRRLSLWENTVVLDNRWAEVDSEGNPTPSSMGMAATDANEALGMYVDLLRSLEWKVATPEVTPVADPGHRWGLTPFHYTPDFYTAAADALVNTLHA